MTARSLLAKRGRAVLFFPFFYEPDPFPRFYDLSPFFVERDGCSSVHREADTGSSCATSFIFFLSQTVIARAIFFEVGGMNLSSDSMEKPASFPEFAFLRAEGSSPFYDKAKAVLRSASSLLFRAPPFRYCGNASFFPV